MSPLGRTIRWLALLLALAIATTATAHAAETWVWHDRDESGQVRVHLYFFWSSTCPHCAQARPIVDAVARERPWLVVHSGQVDADADARALYIDIAESLGETPRFVPAFALCHELHQGLLTRTALAQRLDDCHAGHRSESRPPPAEVTVALPLLGTVDATRWSLPVTTIVLAALDAFNPCAFFVLLFLMSLLVRARSRRRMLVVAGIFVAFSGLWYFLFMAAWLNVFLWVGEIQAVTRVAGVVAIAMGGLNIKDFWLGGRGPSLSIPEAAKPGLFARMRKLVSTTSGASAVLGTVVLAAAANSYELLCTAGFPMVFTRVLTLADLSTGTYYLYLALYNVVYVIPLAVIVALFVVTLGSRKLQAREGRVLKLLSGSMMAGLGLALLFAPAALSRVDIAVGLLAAAGAVTALMSAVERRLHPTDARPERED